MSVGADWEGFTVTPQHWLDADTNVVVLRIESGKEAHMQRQNNPLSGIYRYQTIRGRRQLKRSGSTINAAA